MSEIFQRNQLFVLPYPEGEELHYYGISNFKKEFKITSLKETLSPEGGEWSFMYNGELNRLYIEKDGNTFSFMGNITEELIDKLRVVFSIRG